MVRNNRLFAIEEAYVTIFKEYSPFFCFPVLYGSRDLGAGGWSLRYDLSKNSNLAIPKNLIDSSNMNQSVPFFALWQDIYMTDLRWGKNPSKVNWTPSGLPYDMNATTGFQSKLSFNAAHFGDTLWRMAGFMKYYRVFLDIKASPSSPIERSWEFRGVSVDSNEYSGSPITLSRGFSVKEIPETDGIITLDGSWRANSTFMRPDGPDTIPGIEVNGVRSGSQAIITGEYKFILTVNSGPTYQFSWNGINYGAAISWTTGITLSIDGNEAGVISFVLTDLSHVTTASTLTETITVIE